MDRLKSVPRCDRRHLGVYVSSSLCPSLVVMNVEMLVNE